MRHSIENDILKVEVDTHGAELKSVINKNTGSEYMWCADPKYWGRTSPVLFPFVGDVNGGKYRFEGKEYSMSSHGFARDTEFELVSLEENAMWFVMKDNEESYVNYPFRFALEIGYVLNGSSLDVIWKVSNPGQEREDQKLYFSIGAHPAFNCPFPVKGSEIDDSKMADTRGEVDITTQTDGKIGYKMTFGNATEFHHHGNLTGTCTHEDILQTLDNHKLTIDEETFGRSTYIVEDKQLDTVGLETPDGKCYVNVTFDTPLVGIWSPIGKHAPFICIEPWCGRADYDDYDGELQDREYGNAIMPDELFQNVYHIEFK